MTSAEAMGVIRKLQLEITPDARAAVLRPPPQTPPHEQATLTQAATRLLLTRARADG